MLEKFSEFLRPLNDILDGLIFTQFVQISAEKLYDFLPCKSPIIFSILPQKRRNL